MDTRFLINLYKNTPIIKDFNHSVQNKRELNLSGLPYGFLSVLVGHYFEQNPSTLTLVFNDKEQSAYVLNDLETFLGKERVLFYPSSYKRPYQIEQTDNANVLLRAEVINKIYKNDTPYIVVTYIDALFEKIITQSDLHQSSISLKVGDKLSMEMLNQTLFDYEFHRVDFVTEPGEFSVRGGIIDVFSFSNEMPYRIEFFDDEIDSIRIFDIQTQLSEQKATKISIIPNIENKQSTKKRQSFFKLLPSNSLVFTLEMAFYKDKVEKFFALAHQEFQNETSLFKSLEPSELFCSWQEILQGIKAFKHINLLSHFEGIFSEKVLGKKNEGAISIENGSSEIFSTEISTEKGIKSQKEGGEEKNIKKYKFSLQPSFEKKFEKLADNINHYYLKGYSCYLLCQNVQQIKKFDEIFQELHTEVNCQRQELPIHQGFIDHHNQFVFYTDHQVLERYYKFNIKQSLDKKSAMTLQELSSLVVGDFVTHIDYGIAKFGGLKKIEERGYTQEVLLLIYAERDVLYVPIHALHKISKYSGKDSRPPKIHKLGSQHWKSLKQKTKARVKEIAFNLIELYAKRKQATGYAFSQDSYLQKQLEASFIYEDTPDQQKATIEVKMDMESPSPMDRLVCGDVGFGKTEVAIRAAFKAVDNSKQVAVLVPTTILAFQHYKTFSQRLENLPVTIEYLNRFRTIKEKNDIIKRLKEGKIDILIGTHQIVSDQVAFKDLGLLIIDEEQKFGVAVKDKLKTLKENLDVLTLTATPIPRTLQFSLMAARDLSVIATPPANRYPIQSEVIKYDPEIIRDAIIYELQRGGQVFFIHNRVENILEMAGILQRLVPDARIGIGHGQMEGKKLEEVMLKFMEGYYDILVATTIIESGLDVPNANTIFIHNANHFGLSDLHQMRGRVGRSNKKAFCYFIIPDYHSLTDDARKRMNAIAQFTDLGSGINIAMKDLEIRGAGDILGGEQSGFINDIGFDAYQKILQEAVEELKFNEFEALYQDEMKEDNFVKEAQLDTDFEIFLPESYVNSTNERFSLYNRLSLIKNEKALTDFEMSLKDRFGKLPRQGVDLLNSIRVKWLAEKLGFEKMTIKQNKITAMFISNADSQFYQSEQFLKIIKYISTKPVSHKVQEKQTKYGLRLFMYVENITSIEKALIVLKEIKDFSE